MIYHMMLLLIFPCLISGLTANSIYLSDIDALKHIKRLGFLSKYLNTDLIIEERSIADELNTFDRAMEPEQVAFFLRSLIQRELLNSRTVINYLDDFGYLDGYVNLKSESDAPAALKVMSTEDLEGALALFQFMDSLNPTGFVDSEVLDQMKIPRCGLPDIDPEDPSLSFYNSIGTVRDAQELIKKLKLSTNSVETVGDITDPREEDNRVDLNKRYKVSDEGLTVLLHQRCLLQS